MIDLIVNFLLYAGFAFFLYKRHCGVSVNVLVFSFLAIIAFIGVCIYDTEYYNWGYYNWCLDHTRNKISFSPLLFLFIGFLIYYISIARVNTNEIKTIGQIAPWAENALYYINVIFLILFLITFRNAASNISDFADSYKDGFNGATYGFFGRYAMSIGSSLKLIQFILPYYLFTKNNKSAYLKGILLLCLTFAMLYLKSKLIGSRGVLFFAIIYTLFMFYFFKGFFSNKLNKLFCIVGGIVIFLFASLAIAISFDRFGEKLIFSIASYFGEPFLNFPLIYWNYPNFFEGKVILSEIFGGSSFYIPIGIDFFKTLPGSIYLDFGIVGTLIFLIIYALIGRLFLGSFKENITLSQLYVYTFLYQGLIFGAFSFDVYNWKSYFIMFLIYLFLRVTKRETVYE